MSVVNPLAHLTDDELVAAHMQQGANSFHLTEMLRRHKVESAVLGHRIGHLNVLLLIFTVVLCLLTAVLVWTAFREIHDDRRQSTLASPVSRVGVAWVVLWERNNAQPFEPDGGWKDMESCREEVRRRVAKMGPSSLTKSENLLILKLEDGTRHVVSWRCLPDTVDPREPKGK
jgi:hypothetical protein